MQRQAREKSLSDSSTTEDTDVTTSSGTDEMERRCGQVDSSSQDSQEADSQTAGLSNAGGGLVRVDSSQSDLKSVVTTEVVMVSAKLENMGQLSTKKRPCPSDTCSEPAGKKLKRRNVSFYTAEAGDEASK
ncbi:hypothetical protein BaRGS_00032011 [Batillaria attramentaria]|uniref:Uncharacterized protein n=1 Tax=Batillaria attramentaria TaxID=370345 RepID=A0ABD0JPG8_9CAEN